MKPEDDPLRISLATTAQVSASCNESFLQSASSFAVDFAKAADRAVMDNSNDERIKAMAGTPKMWTEDEIKEIADQAVVDAFGSDNDQKLWSDIACRLISSLPWIVLCVGVCSCIAYGSYLISEYESQPAVICVGASHGIFGSKEAALKCLETLQRK